MKRKSRIVWFYLIIAAFSFVIIFGMRYLGELSKESASRRHLGLTELEIRKAQQAELKKFSQYGLKQDLMVTLQDDRHVNLKEELKGKVTVLVQYFSG